MSGAVAASPGYMLVTYIADIADPAKDVTTRDEVVGWESQGPNVAAAPVITRDLVPPASPSHEIARGILTPAGKIYEATAKVSMKPDEWVTTQLAAANAWRIEQASSPTDPPPEGGALAAKKAADHNKPDLGKPDHKPELSPKAEPEHKGGYGKR